MSRVLVCVCGRRVEPADERALIRCPDCGRELCAFASTGLRALWPRLALAATVTLLGVLAFGFLLVRFLPATHRGELDSAATVSEQDNKLLADARGADKPLADARGSDKPLADPLRKVFLPIAKKPTAPNVLPPLPPRERPNRKPPPKVHKPLSGPQIGDEFFQQVVISRVSRYRILETDLGQNTQYVFVSRLRIKAKDAAGMRVEQKVESTRLSDADPVLKARLDELLRKMKGATFTLTLNDRREVTKFEGPREAIEVFSGQNPLGGSSFLLWSFLDRDGWKELAELSFFQPPEAIVRGDKWERPMTHSWGPLGAWKGKIHFQFTARQINTDRFDYLLDLSYKPPGKSGGLPFEIGRSEFRIRTARGGIAYDPRRRRVTEAEERFRVEGQLAISCLGIESVVQMDEVQRVQLRILDRNPLAK